MSLPFVWMLDDEWEDHSFEEYTLKQAGYTLFVSRSNTFTDDWQSFGKDASALIQQVGFFVPTDKLLCMKKLKIIVVPGVGYDHVDVTTANKMHVWVSSIPDYCTSEVSDHTLAMILYFHRNLGTMNRDLRSGIWDTMKYRDNRRTSSSILGLLGYGRIGKRVAEKAIRFGFKIIAYDPFVQEDKFAKYVKRVNFETLLTKSDYISIHVPATVETNFIINDDAISHMKENAVIINTSRGSIIDEISLINALKSSQIRGAALDVFQTEPLPENHPFVYLDNVLLTPHSAYVTGEALMELKIRTCMEITRVLTGQAPLHAIKN